MTTADDFKKVFNELYEGVYFVDRDRTVTFWNKAATQITGYSAEEVVGKKCSDGILVHTDMEGNFLCDVCCPLGETTLNDGIREKEMYFHHKEGHRVSVKVRTAPLRDEQGTIVGGVEIFTPSPPQSMTSRQLADLEKLAYADALTGVPNRRYAEIALHARLEELQRYGWNFGVLFIDIDNFKDVNDRFGHVTGDEVLKMVARTLQNSVREFDIISRWGGEEFVGIIIHVTHAELIAAANRCRALVERSSLSEPQPVSVTISLGGTLARKDDTVPLLIKRADEHMYKCKLAGRNCITVDE